MARGPKFMFTVVRLPQGWRVLYWEPIEEWRTAIEKVVMVERAFPTKADAMKYGRDENGWTPYHAKRGEK